MSHRHRLRSVLTPRVAVRRLPDCRVRDMHVREQYDAIRIDRNRGVGENPIRKDSARKTRTSRSKPSKPTRCGESCRKPSKKRNSNGVRQSTPLHNPAPARLQGEPGLVQDLTGGRKAVSNGIERGVRVGRPAHNRGLQGEPGLVQRFDGGKEGNVKGNGTVRMRVWDRLAHVARSVPDREWGLKYAEAQPFRRVPHQMEWKRPECESGTDSPT